MSELRSALIRLAQEKPELRRHILPLLKKAALGDVDPDTKYVVYKGHTLGYINVKRPNDMGVLAIRMLDGGDPRTLHQGPISIWGGDKKHLRPATRKDFDRFRVYPPPGF